MNRSTNRRPWLDRHARPTVDVPSLLVGFGAGALLAFGLCVLVSWRVGL